MKSAVLYLRVSTADQHRTGHSVPDQRALLTAWCGRRGHRIARTFLDDESAKAGDEIGQSFERRPGWREMTAYLEGCPAGDRPGLLLIKDWSRFSRDITSALVMIHRLRQLGVEVQSVESPVDWNSPESLLQVLIPLGTAEVENRRRSVNVRRGMRRAMKEGRWVSAPPVGYVRSRDERDRPTIAPDPVQAPLVAAAFEIAADPAVPIAEVYRRAKVLGLRVGRSRFFTLLRNPVYVGEIVVSSWESPHGSEPEEKVAAQHEPIVDRATFSRVQARLDNPRLKGQRASTSPSGFAFPLRGHLLCPHCQRPATGSAPRGRSCRYPYYSCHRCNADRTARAAGRTFRHRLERVHEAFGDHLSEVAIAPEIAAVYAELASEMAREAGARGRREAKRIRTKIADLEGRRGRAEDLYIDGGLDRDAYARTTERIASQIEDLEQQLAGVSEADAERLSEEFRFGALVISDLRGAWDRVDVELKSALVGSIWPAGVVFDGDGFGTTPESELIGLLGGKRGESETAPAAIDRGRPVWYARQDSNL